MSAPTIAERVAASRAAQGLPPKIADPEAIAKIAGVVRVSTRAGDRR